jgi:predicted  nucleic acid-binding Zn-ribbon protein
MFSQSSSQLSKVAVLESKLDMYESLSREMLAKLEAAVDKISEGNSRIATILTKHDERIEQSSKTDELLIKMIEEVRSDNSREHSQVIKRIEKIEQKVEDITKFRWLIVGVFVLVSFFFSNYHVVMDVLTPNDSPATVQRQK